MGRVSNFIKKTKLQMNINNQKIKLIRDWGLVMTHTNTYNQKGCTFEIVEEALTNYGWRFKVLAAKGLCFDSLETLTPVIKTGLGCAYFMYKVNESNTFAICDVIYSQKLKLNEKPFEPLDVKPYELYFGNMVNGEPIKCNINIGSQVFIAGQTRRGKNGALNHCLLSLMHSNSSKDVMILYYQAAKGDGAFYKNCKHVYAYGQYDITQLLTMLEFTLKEMESRSKLIETVNMQGGNIFAYNNANKNKRLPYIYLVIDEFLECVINKSDTGKIKKTKQEIETILTKIAQYGGSLGVNYIISHQKPTKDLCPPFLKNQSNIRICFGYEDSVCSEIVLGSGDISAVGLPPRRAILKMFGEKNLIFTTNLTGRIEKYIKMNTDLNRKDLFKDLKKDKVNKECTNTIDLSRSNKNLNVNSMTIKHNPNMIKNTQNNNDVKISNLNKKKSKEDLLAEFIKKTPGYIPFNDEERQLIDRFKTKK